MRVLVTGGAGLIGSHLCSRLLKEGHEVICMDNLHTSTGLNIQNFAGSSEFSFIQQDITVPMDIAAERIYNLACPASPVHYQLDPVRTVKTSVLGTINVLEIARKYGSRILQASTSEVYGNPQVHPQPESYWGNVNPIGKRSCYDEGKRCAETLFYDYRRQFEVDIRVARIFNTYGPGMALQDGRVIGNFILQALSGEDITLYGDGSQTRCFCYVSDMVNGLMALMESDISQPVNLGNPVEISMGRLAEEIITLTDSSSAISYQPLPEDDPLRRKPNIALAESRLDWRPSVSLATGLAETIRYFKTLTEGE
ncbi:MAG: SDR family oxidoreductase [FCB group bacterium]|nr:SDR family oxidoreductase [FCB group bacterium]